MCNIKYFICDPVSVTKNCDLLKQKQNINVILNRYYKIATKFTTSFFIN